MSLGEAARMATGQCKRMMPLERRNEPQMLRQFSKMYPSYNLNPLLRRRHQQLVEAQAFNEWLSNRRLRQDGETYADELGRMTEAVNRRIPQLRYAPAERAGVQRMARTWPLVETPASPKSMAALCEMKLNLQLAKREGTWLLWSPEAEIPLAYEEELEDEDGQEILRLLGRRWTRPQRVLVRYDALTHTVLSYLCEVVQRASERSYLGKRGLKLIFRELGANWVPS